MTRGKRAWGEVGDGLRVGDLEKRGVMGQGGNVMVGGKGQCMFQPRSMFGYAGDTDVKAARLRQ